MADKMAVLTKIFDFRPKMADFRKIRDKFSNDPKEIASQPGDYKP